MQRFVATLNATADAVYYIDHNLQTLHPVIQVRDRDGVGVTYFSSVVENANTVSLAFSTDYTDLHIAVISI